MSEQLEQPAAPPPAPPKPKEEPAMTEYLMLKKAGNDTWAMGPTITARGANAAIRKHVETAGEGTYVAVPTRSWQPVTVEQQVVERMVFK
jgi:hypothetical protein